MKKYSYILLLICAILCLTSCSGGGEETTVPAENTESPMPDIVHKLVENGEAQYAVVLPEGSNGDMREAVNSFADKLSDLYGVKFEVKKNKNLAEGKKLIMVGAQDDNAYASYYADVAYREYAVKLTDDGNIVIAAWNVGSIGDACSKLILKLKKAVDSGNTDGELTEDILFVGYNSSMLDAEIPHFSLTRMPRIYNVQGARGAYELCFKDTAPEECNRYISVLTENGYSLLQQNSNSDASFAVLRKDGVEITVDYWHATQDLAVIIDKPSYEAPFVTENITSLTVPKVIEPGLEYDGALKGMCYILQASDGSFVLIDGGDSDPKFLDRLYSVLNSLISEGQKPHIRAWFITHQHVDHTSGISDIAESQYASLIECDAVYSNMPYSTYQSAYTASNYENRYEKIEKAAKKLGADFVIARTGQTYYFADIEIRILGSVDDMFLSDYNDLDETSIIFTASVGSKRLIFTGDAGPITIGQYIMKRYTAETLGSDICQAASHGSNNSAFTPFYKLVDPDIYLWPASIEFYNKHTPSKYIEGDTSAKIVYSFNGQYTIELN